ncbi:hypothetical protein [Streptomyces aureoversilis]|uniref:Secreted protein n=1 Tax=Streptomyces aureoversilis TaxID=67277 RepID=A0ABV9ZY55_9ACTN
MRIAPIVAALAVPAAVLFTAGSASAVTPHVVQQTFQDNADVAATHTILCPPGEHATGGGASISDPRRNYISGSHPTPTANGWTVTTAPINANHDPRFTTVHAVCT